MISVKIFILKMLISYRNVILHRLSLTPRFGQLADTAPVCHTGGKPSTWFPPERLVEQDTQLQLQAQLD